MEVKIRIVVAAQDGHGLALWTWTKPTPSKWTVEDYFTDFGRHIEDLGLDDAPEGISVWEGDLVTTESWTDCGKEYDTELEPANREDPFRDLTDAEWAAIRTGQNPWGEVPSRSTIINGTSTEE